MPYALGAMRKGVVMAVAGSIVRVTDVTKVFKLGKIDVEALYLSYQLPDY